MNDAGLKFHVIGDPIDHSLSPAMHNFFLEKFKINGNYTARRVPIIELGAAISDFKNEGVNGINVTTPLKQEVLKYIDELTPEAKIIGSVNTIKIEPGKLTGHNTDAIGFQASLKILNYSCKEKNAFIFGAGGAARAVLVALSRGQCQKLFISNRDFERARNFTADFSQQFSETEFAAIPLDSDKINRLIKSCSLLVNATTVGMGNLSNDSLLPGLNCLHKDLLVYDLVYRPIKTKLIQQAESRGVPGITGLEMLIFQGIESLKFWIGQDLLLDESSYGLIKDMLRREICQE